MLFQDRFHSWTKEIHASEFKEYKTHTSIKMGDRWERIRQQQILEDKNKDLESDVEGSHKPVWDLGNRVT